MSTIAIIPIPGVPQIKPGDDLPAILLKAIDDAKVGLKDGDILVMCQKIVSKAEGAVIDLKTVTPSPFATANCGHVGERPAHGRSRADRE